MCSGHTGVEEVADWLDEDMSKAAANKMNQMRMHQQEIVIKTNPKREPK